MSSVLMGTLGAGLSGCSERLGILCLTHCYDRAVSLRAGLAPHSSCWPLRQGTAAGLLRLHLSMVRVCVHVHVYICVCADSAPHMDVTGTVKMETWRMETGNTKHLTFFLVQKTHSCLTLTVTQKASRVPAGSDIPEVGDPLPLLYSLAAGAG